ncbi:hypothetical protein JTB14_025601 [Gonioctena quinquepunctata]|nr:hypothetical protein JTB14_025601 [Gonioctena quinquepunctata]
MAESVARVLLTRHALKNPLPVKLLSMMAKRIRKSDEEIQDAVEAVINQNLPIRSVAKNTGISKSLLAKLVKKHRNSPDGNFRYIRNIGNRKTFTEGREKLLVSYLRTTSKMCHGLTTTQTRNLAYQFAVANKVDTPAEWNKNQPSTSADPNRPTTSGIGTVKRNVTKEGREELGIVSPEMLRPYRTAPLRKQSRTRGRKKVKCSIITDTPEEDELMKAEEERNNKSKKRGAKAKIVMTAEKKHCSSDSDTDGNISLHDESPPPRYLKEYLSQIEQELDPSNVEEKKDSEEYNSTCVACSGEYRLSRGEFIQCRLCNQCAHKSCGIIGNLNLFCKKCF